MLKNVLDVSQTMNQTLKIPRLLLLRSARLLQPGNMLFFLVKDFVHTMTEAIFFIAVLLSNNRHIQRKSAF